jgi:hypothetical protein
MGVIGDGSFRLTVGNVAKFPMPGRDPGGFVISASSASSAPFSAAV